MMFRIGFDPPSKIMIAFEKRGLLASGSGLLRTVVLGLVVLLGSIMTAGRAQPGNTRMTVDGEGAVILPDATKDLEMSLEAALQARRSVRDFAASPIDLEALAQLSWAAQGVTSSEGFRTAPSAGALYPLELFVVAGNVPSLPAGIYRYKSKRHQLLPVVSGDRRQELATAALHQTWIADAPAVVVVAALFERTTGKYGERGIRYVHIEAGHAAENLCLQAVSLGVGTTVVGAFSDDSVKRVLDLADEEPLLLIPVGKPR